MNRILFWLATAAFLLGGGFTVVKACCGGPSCPPLTLSVACDPHVLWPPNHEYVDIAMVIKTNGTLASLKVVSSQPDNAIGLGDGDTTNDCFIVNTSLCKVRAERDGHDPDKVGRYYTILAAATDACGAWAYSSDKVWVPHSPE